jgi:hypothetical protein
MKSKNCGNCQSFRKSKDVMYSSGICDIYNCRVSTDSLGTNCIYWKRTKYSRVQTKIIFHDMGRISQIENSF